MSQHWDREREQTSINEPTEGQRERENRQAYMSQHWDRLRTDKHKGVNRGIEREQTSLREPTGVNMRMEKEVKYK